MISARELERELDKLQPGETTFIEISSLGQTKDSLKYSVSGVEIMRLDNYDKPYHIAYRYTDDSDDSRDSNWKTGTLEDAAEEAVLRALADGGKDDRR